MPQPSTMPLQSAPVVPEDELRAQVYRLLSHFLSAPPSKTDLDAGAALTGDDSTMGQAVSTFARLCGKSNPANVADEYQALFIGLGRGELVPYGSYYMTGFLHEKPLAKLRQDMEAYGLERDSETKEPEDHIASVLEMMAGFIDGRFGSPLTAAEQKQFFKTHIGSWAGQFFTDLEAAKASVLYAALGTLGRVFLEIENGAFEMV